MVYLKEKIIAGRKYAYLTKSIRLPDGKVKTIQKLIKGTEKQEKYVQWFDVQEKKLIGNWAVKRYSLNSVFDEEQIRVVEAMKVDYKRILARLSKQQLKDIFDRFTVNFTYESNAIEGNSLTLKDVAIVIFEKIMIKGKELREIYETRNSRKVVDLIMKRKFRVSEKDVIKMHKMLVKDMEIATGYKKIPNYIMGHAVETAPPERVQKEMNRLLAYYNENSEKIHPLQLAAHMHGNFEKIHPFDDGNGRVGRFLINVMLINKGYPPLIIRKTQRAAYFRCLEDFDNGYKINLERFLLEKYKDTYKKFFEVYVKYLH